MLAERTCVPPAAALHPHFQADAIVESGDAARGRMPTCSTFLEAWLRLTLSVEGALMRGFSWWGRSLSIHPFRWLAFSILLSAGLGAGFVRLRVESRGDVLWSPSNSDSAQYGDYVSSPASFGRPPHLQEVILASASPDGNLLTISAISSLFDIADLIRSFSPADRECSFDLVCQRRRSFNGTGAECMMINSVLLFWSGSRTAFLEEIGSNETKLLETVSKPAFPGGGLVFRPSVFGGVHADSELRLVRASALYLGLLMRSEPPEVEKCTKLFEEELETRLLAHADSISDQGLELVFRMSDSYDRELERSVGGDITLVVLSFFFMIGFLLLTLGELDLVRGRVCLSIGTVFSFALAIVAAYGFGSAVGIPFISIHQILWFLIVGVGCDDVFMLSTLFDMTSQRLSVSERIELAAMHGGVAVSVTSFTTIGAFAIGTWTRIPAIRYFCAYASLSFFFLWLFAITTFLPLLALDERRRQAQRYDVLPCFKRAQRASLESESDMPASRRSGEKLATLLLRKYSANLLRPFVKVSVLIVAGLILGVHVYGATKLNEDFELIDIVPDDSFLFEYNRIVRERFESIPLIVEVHFRNIEASDARIQAGMIEFIESTRRSRYFVPDAFESWIHSFVSWYRLDPAYNSSLTAEGFLSRSQFSVALHEFLALPEFADFSQDLLWSSDNTQVLSSRARVVHVPLLDSADRKNALEESKMISSAAAVNRNIGDSADFNAFLFSPWYVFFEQLLIIISQLVSNFGASVAVVLLVATVMLAHPGMMLIVGVTVIAMDVHILGSLWWWNLSINAITVAQLVMAVGIIIDYNLHFAHGFLRQASNLTRDERVQSTFSTIGGSILLSASSTFVGIVPLAFASSLVFRSFFKCFVSIVGVGLTHGMIVLPVVLSLIGPSIPDKLNVTRPVMPTRDAIDNDKTEGKEPRPSAGAELAIQSRGLHGTRSH